MNAVFQSIFQSFQQTTTLEWIGIIFGLLSVYFFIKVNILSWPTTLVSVGAFAFFFFHIHLYADALLQIFFFVISSLGWWEWSRKKKGTKELPITVLSHQEKFKMLIIIIAGSLLSGFLFSRYTDAHYPYWDSLASVMSVVAQILLIRKKFENWILWIVIDILSIGIYVAKDVPFTALLFTLYLFMATRGFFEWKELYRRQLKESFDTV